MSTTVRRKIALVLMHDIGERRPMETLREFVKFIFAGRARSKPDRLTDLFEVRRLDVRTSESDVHCYELYWAHHMHASPPSNWYHIAKWLWQIARISGKNRNAMGTRLPCNFYIWLKISIIVVIAFAVAIAVAIILAVACGYFEAGAGAALAVAISSFITIFLSVLNSQFNSIAAAIRYLDSAPVNVGFRQAIRTDCVRFLKSISSSDDPGYERIILVGHGVGSAIAYDALNLLWASLKPHAKLPGNVAKPNGPLPMIYTSREGAVPSPQRALFTQLVAPSADPWRITDLVTVGSPLTHAPVLFARTMDEFENLKDQRELPTSPPKVDDKTESNSVYCGWYTEEVNNIKPHHAAVFAVVQWTNLYFPSDLIGGPLQALFGDGVIDIELVDPPLSTWMKWTSHFCYWKDVSEMGSICFKAQVLGITNQAV